MTFSVNADPEADPTENQSQTQSPKIFSVEQLNRHIRQLIEGELSSIWVQGEISNFVAHSSGHFYFSLKDSKAQIKAVMFRGHNSKLKFKPHAGLEVILRGKVSVYEPRGDYQIMCEFMEPVGAGALQKAFEQLKEKLKGEGLFETAKKRVLPAYPKHIVIVTSPTGAAIRDILNILSRRNKTAQVTIVPTLVQGEGSAPQIVLALQKAYRLPKVDVVIVGRGGGSIEDLWAFNDEQVARTIALSPVPIISAVGHEIDFTIADFVADLRAPTPSAAAELVVKNSFDLITRLKSTEQLLMSLMLKGLERQWHQTKNFTTRLIDPKRKLQDLFLKNDDLVYRLNRGVLAYLQNKSLKAQLLRKKLVSPEAVLQKNVGRLKVLNLQLASLTSKKAEACKFKFLKLTSVLDSLSPLKVLDRGYAVVMKQDKIVKSVKDVAKNDELVIKFNDGSVNTKVL